MATEADVRAIALGMASVTEKPSYGTPGWRVADKLFARMKEDGELLVLWTPSEEHKRELVAADSSVFSTTPHYDGHAAVLVRLSAVDTAQLTELLADAWEVRAPRKLKDQRPG